MIVAHSAHWGWKSCACDGTPQVVIGIAVSPGKMRAGEPEDGLDVWSGFALREQISGDPQIHDAPVRLRKAFENMPSQHTTPVDRGSFCHAGGGKLSGGRVGVERESKCQAGCAYCLRDCSNPKACGAKPTRACTSLTHGA